jgi:uncharacterized membrane protein YhaH (DUF805 family)
MEWYLKVMKENYSNFSGRARRKEYWMFVLFNVIISTILSMIEPTVYLIYVLAILVPSIAVGVRRLHDVGKSGWFMFIALVPIIGGIWLLILACTDGDSGDNEYGSNPKTEEGVA